MYDVSCWLHAQPSEVHAHKVHRPCHVLMVFSPPHYMPSFFFKKYPQPHSWTWTPVNYFLLYILFQIISIKSLSLFWRISLSYLMIIFVIDNQDNQVNHDNQDNKNNNDYKIYTKISLVWKYFFRFLSINNMQFCEYRNRSLNFELLSLIGN